MKKWIALGVLAVLFFFVLVLGIGLMVSYNGLVSKSQAVDAQWAKVQSAYQRRSDLIPNLVQTVQGSANFEKSTLTEIAEARASVGRVTIDASKAPEDAAKLQQYQAAQGQLSNALSHLMAVSENYPDLKSSANFKGLQDELAGTENRINFERNAFNDMTRDYDTAIHSFPTMIAASMGGFKDKPYFEASTTAQTAPAVNFNIGGK